MPGKGIKGIPDISAAEDCSGRCQRRPVNRVMLETSGRFADPTPDGLKSSLLLLIKGTARWHFMSLPLFIVKFLVPLHSPCFQMRNVFLTNKMRPYVLRFFKAQPLICHIVIQSSNWEGDGNDYQEAWGM